MFYEAGDEDASERAVSPAHNLLSSRLMAERSEKLKISFSCLLKRRQGSTYYFMLTNHRQVKYFRRLPEMAKLFYFFRLPNAGTNFFFDVCRTSARFNIFNTCRSAANLFMLFFVLSPAVERCLFINRRWCGNGLRFWRNHDVCADHTSLALLPRYPIAEVPTRWIARFNKIEIDLFRHLIIVCVPFKTSDCGQIAHSILNIRRVNSILNSRHCRPVGFSVVPPSKLVAYPARSS